MDTSRYYPVNRRETLAEDRGNDYYRSHIAALYQKCLGHQSRQLAIYIGDLGTRCYLPYHIATSQSFGLDLLRFLPKQSLPQDGMESEQMEKARRQILEEALSFADQVRHHCHVSSRAQRVSLLEGELVGALTMKIVIITALLSLVDSFPTKGGIRSALKSDLESCKDELLQFGMSHVMPLPPAECEVLYGRAGFLKALSFVRRETIDPEFGTDLARNLIGQIWNEGKRFSKQLKCPIPLMWEWHSSLYLGAAHGVTGILHSLLDFPVELLQVDERALKTIDQTLEQLNGYCFESGNLVSSLPQSGDFKDKKDRLVQFCHGSPGHVLLLVQMFVASRTKYGAKHLTMAKQIVESTIFPRGILRKGVGLCHGISGNAYCFLSVHNAELKESTEGKREHQHNSWLRYAYTYANFALDNFDELEKIPDRPYSLFEGLAGLVCFLLDLVGQKDGAQSHFPCYEL
jgi:hypothetical protein